VILGRGVVTRIVFQAVADGSAMRKAITQAAAPEQCALASRMAWRSEPAPSSAVVVT
jgi:hypothetical protein